MPWQFYGCSPRQLGSNGDKPTIHLTCSECRSMIHIKLEIGDELVIPEKCEVCDESDSEDNSGT